ncbi:hypothetical protein MPRS_20000 [Mycobacterium paraseoulense]|nr:hypothetical protein MPRS_20000 [Mycobacterium paraseoulense]
MSDSVGHPYQTAITGTVSDPSITNPNRQTNSPRLSHVCIRAQADVVPGGSGSAGATASTVDSDTIVLPRIGQSEKISRFTVCR